MTKSSDEAEIRSFVVDRLRGLMPGARIVHELNVAGTGTNRIDVAAVTTSAIVAVEVKSKKDTLVRLDEQWPAFNRCCHFVIVAAHDKHFAEFRDPQWRDDIPSEPRLNHPIFFKRWNMERHVWRYPTPLTSRMARESFHPAKDTIRQPRAEDLLFMLWANELRDECSRHRLHSGGRATRPDMVRDMVWHMTGREIAEAVCRQLRQRTFAEADPPIYAGARQPSMFDTTLAAGAPL
ncbi:hypothetical protein [Rhizobium sp. 18065]|uniref:hypothetical protein n=1 Tax=Rhizobium sp. 18065 TaxID=2681411 RepID=UPI00135AEF7C|nr:hypothetical protein [Rhizobium sp. 18065]